MSAQQPHTEQQRVDEQRVEQPNGPGVDRHAALDSGPPLSRWETTLRMGLGVGILGVGGVFWLLTLLLLLPFRRLRTQVSNVWVRPIARSILLLTKSRYLVEGRAHLTVARQTQRPVLFVSNHSSLLDIIIAAWLAPLGTITVGKKEILRYPLVGWLFALSGCLAVDRKHPRQAAQAVLDLGETVKKHPVHVFFWPEGTRLANGRPKRFKKGFVRLALLGGFDIVPIVVEGAHLAWPNRTLQLCPTTVRIVVHPVVRTSDWQMATLSHHVEEVFTYFRAANSS
ncbi:MAG: 1-acyl-sn-glycerol-3-phosphate acyltransferase [Deltaproteobacteria bacterium]|nr:1-acyl-sn-glycerol-3-phosphate acyltransferase [Deltaproteobacteria bacterium]